MSTHNPNILYMTNQRRHVLRALLQAEKPLTIKELTHLSGMRHDTVSTAMQAFEDHSWLVATGQDGRPRARRVGVIRLFRLADYARTYAQHHVDQLGE